MLPRELKQHKLINKQLNCSDIEFLPLKKGSLPGQFKRLGRPNAYSSGFVPVSDGYKVLFVWRDGELMTDSSFYGYLVHHPSPRDRQILLELHWHPSHKGIHCVTPCNTELNLNNRMLVAQPDINLNGNLRWDPRVDKDRKELIQLFCDVCGITAINATSSVQFELWN